MKLSPHHLLYVLVCLIFAAPACTTAPRPEAERPADPADTPGAGSPMRFDAYFRVVDGTFYLLDSRTGRTIQHNPERAAQPLPPASTFKIPHALIALETRIAGGPGYALSRDPSVAPEQEWWPEIWTEDHTLGSALTNSVVWYFQKMARLIGEERMQAHVDQFAYGNRDLSGGVDQFWLTGGLRISAREQVDFLKRFYFGELGASRRSTEIVKDLLILESTPNYRLSGKTGWAGLGDPEAPDIGWFVGYLERDGNVYFFATNIDIELHSDAAKRVGITRAILEDLGLIQDTAANSGNAAERRPTRSLQRRFNRIGR